ncbi:hypothetical protein EDD15DRAFT_2196011 [Pisolithus albus]|nr:hypothetical protein EDD15DRAFT_2196011 [Pisolithus albus]
MSPVPTLPLASLQHSAQITNEFTLLDPRMRESLYEKCWAKAVIKRQRAVDSMEEAQEEYKDHASDIIAVVGQDDYNRLLENLLGALKECSPTASAKIQGHGGFRKDPTTRNALMLSAQYSVGDYTYTSVSHVRPYGLPRWVALFTLYYSSHTSFIKQCTHHILSYVMNNLTPLRDLTVAMRRTGIMMYDHRVHEALYERHLLVSIDIPAFTHWKLPSRGRPLSYAEILRHWTKAVIKRQRAIHHTEETQDEYEDSASDVIAVVGQDEYYKFLEVLSCALQQHWMVSGEQCHPGSSQWQLEWSLHRRACMTDV